MARQKIPRAKSLQSLNYLTEKELTKQIFQFLNYIPRASFKKIRGGLGMRGVLDIIGCWQGKYVELEVKTKRGRVSIYNDYVYTPTPRLMDSTIVIYPGGVSICNVGEYVTICY